MLLLQNVTFAKCYFYNKHLDNLKQNIDKLKNVTFIFAKGVALENDFENKVNKHFSERIGEFDYLKKSYFQNLVGEFDYRKKVYFQERSGEFDSRNKDYSNMTSETLPSAPDAKISQNLDSVASSNRDAITKFALGVMATNILTQIR